MGDKTHKSLVPVIIGLVVALSVATGVVWSKKLDQKQSEQTTTTQEQTINSEQGTDPVVYDGVEGKTALELLRTNATVVTKDSAYGPYVDSINGVQGGTGGKYWAFYVNGQMAQVGADAYVTKVGDEIEWKFE